MAGYRDITKMQNNHLNFSTSINDVTRRNTINDVISYETVQMMLSYETVQMMLFYETIQVMLFIALTSAVMPFFTIFSTTSRTSFVFRDPMKYNHQFFPLDLNNTGKDKKLNENISFSQEGEESDLISMKLYWKEKTNFLH
uniref:Uncharacterized protein n=1 Tax=Glossina brevipalpis TaxID=37001 RepID=A0A1A9WLB7_9MUSC